MSALPHYGPPGLSWQDPNLKSDSTAPYPAQGLAHRMVPIEGNKLRTCALCSLNKIKTRSGWGVYTRHKCEACTVPLCKGKRDCFQAFHKVFGYKYEVSDISKPLTNSRSVRHSVTIPPSPEQDRLGGGVNQYKPAQYSYESCPPRSDHGHNSGTPMLSRTDLYGHEPKYESGGQ